MITHFHIQVDDIIHKAVRLRKCVNDADDQKYEHDVYMIKFNNANMDQL